MLLQQLKIGEAAIDEMGRWPSEVARILSSARIM